MDYKRDFIDYSNEFEKQLLQVPHYKKFPQMLPWVGSQYGKDHGKILIISTSHYLPEGSTIQKTPESWYNSSIEDLGIDPIEKESEIRWSDTAGVISSGMKYWNNGGHRIFRTLHMAMEKAGIDLPQGTNNNLFRYMAFYNFFQRPAEVSGESIQNTPEDNKIAYDVFESVVEILNPDAIFVVSKKVWDVLMNKYWETSKPEKENRLQIETKSKYLISGFAPQPSAYKYWNKTYSEYDNDFSGKEEFIDFMREYFVKK